MTTFLTFYGTIKYGIKIAKESLHVPKANKKKIKSRAESDVMDARHFY